MIRYNLASLAMGTLPAQKCIYNSPSSRWLQTQRQHHGFCNLSLYPLLCNNNPALCASASSSYPSPLRWAGRLEDGLGDSVLLPLSLPLPLPLPLLSHLYFKSANGTTAPLLFAGNSPFSQILLKIDINYPERSSESF